MKKSVLRQIAADCGVNYKALKEQLQADGINRKTATARDIYECIYLNAQSLLYCRRCGDGMVEYADPTICRKLIECIKAVKNA